MRFNYTSTASVKTAMKFGEQTVKSGQGMRISSCDLRHLLNRVTGLGIYLCTYSARILRLASGIARFLMNLGNAEMSPSPALNAQPAPWCQAQCKHALVTAT